MTKEIKQKEAGVAIYVRVSTAGKGQDVGMQLRDLRAYATSRGLSIFKEYVDDGISGRKDKRPALDVLMNDARKRRSGIDRLKLACLGMMLLDIEAIFPNDRKIFSPHVKRQGR